MATFLFDKIIFGPVKSRRLGVSLGVNLLPTDSKVCTFDCIYCECGRTPKSYDKKVILPKREEVKNQMAKVLLQMKSNNELPDVITFAGNGEPTMHPKFAEIIDDTIKLRNLYSPKARIAVLSNATILHKKSVFDALIKIDDNIQKLDSAFEETVELMDCPRISFDINKVVKQLKKFNGKVIIQTLFLKGNYKGQTIDNTTSEEISEWLKLIKYINPSQVMIYTIERDTPVEGLIKVKPETLQSIAERVSIAGFEVQVSV